MFRLTDAEWNDKCYYDFFNFFDISQIVRCLTSFDESTFDKFNCQIKPWIYIYLCHKSIFHKQDYRQPNKKFIGPNFQITKKKKTIKYFMNQKYCQSLTWNDLYMKSKNKWNMSKSHFHRLIVNKICFVK